MQMLRSVFTAVAIVVVVAGSSWRAGAQPLADRIPADALLYVGWSGAEKLGPAYAQSHLKGVLDASNLPELFSELGPRIVRRLQLEQMMEGEAFVQEILPTILSAGENAWKRPAAIYFGPLDYSGKQPMPKVAVLLDAGQQSQALADRITKLVAQIPANAPLKIRVKVIEGDLLVVSTFDWLERIDETLAGREQFKSAIKQGRPDAAVTAFFDAEKVLMVASMAINVGADAQTKQMWQKFLMTSGIGGLKRLVYTAGFDGKDWGTQAFIDAPAPRSGLLATLLESEPVSDDLLRNAPRTTTWLAATRLDLAGTLAGVRNGAAGVVPEAGRHVDQLFAEVNKHVGFDVQKELIDTLGDQWLAFNSEETGLGLLGLALVHPLKDAATFERSMTALAKKANEAIAEANGSDLPRVAIETTTIDGVTVHYLAVPAVAPSWAVKDGKLYAALFPQILAAAMGHGTAADQSVLANEQFVAAKKRLGVEKPVSVAYLDLPKLAPRGYQLVLAAQRTALGFADLFGLQTPAMVLPPLNKITPHLAPSASATWLDDAGWHYRGISPFPGADLLGGEQALAATAAPVGAAVLMPALARARQQARMVASMSNLRQIGLGVHMYANDHKGDLPPDLGATQAYITGNQVYVVPDRQDAMMMNMKADMKPDERARWINQNSDYVYVGAGLKMFTIPNPAQRIVAHEKFELARNGIVNVLYVDGHVEAQAAAYVRQQVAEQKKAK